MNDAQLLDISVIRGSLIFLVSGMLLLGVADKSFVMTAGKFPPNEIDILP
jgi:hypothetical protein